MIWGPTPGLCECISPLFLSSHEGLHHLTVIRLRAPEAQGMCSADVRNAFHSLRMPPLHWALFQALGRKRGGIHTRSSHTKVHYILQEVVMGGMVLETNMNEIVAQMEAQNRLEKSEGGLSAAPARAVSAVKNINLPEIPRNINIGDLNIKVPNLSQFV
uniref:AP complex mu/sigma subunit domain-containing protein n=1 Tax=Equus asinus TaxID=9793 RepID=A0A9L0K864_EQUAS